MQTWYRVAAGAIGWFVIGLHYYLIASRPDVGLAEAASRMLSFFTILTDILVALAMTLPWLAPESKLGVFFSRPSVRTAITCYIIVVSAVYYAILRKLWNPEGLQYLADTIEHCVAPALYIVYIVDASSSCRRGRSRQGRSHGGCFIPWVTPPFRCSTPR